jgi:hypothetical protein
LFLLQEPMSIRTLLAKYLAKKNHKKTLKWSQKPIESQKKVFESLILQAKETQFGKDHNFESIQTYQDFRKQIPIRDYEGIKPYIEKVKAGEEAILWPGKPIYFAKTSGTTSGVKYIPITKESMPSHIEAARNAILSYIHETKKADFVDKKMIFLQGSPILEEKNGIKIGRLSGIVAHYVPKYLQKNRMPSWKINCIEDWEEKVDAIVDETIKEDMAVISGIPSWVQMYFEKIKEKTGLPVGEVFKNFNLFIHGGVNFDPYRNKFKKLIGKEEIDSIELYPASEGFFAYQDSQEEEGMLLLLNSGIYYEFIHVEEFYEEEPQILSLEEVEEGENYVMIISTNAGLWRYNIGDTIQFTSLSPYRIMVSGRINHYISAFGEHVIASEVEAAMKSALRLIKASVNEFTVAPQINPKIGLPHHEWFIEFEEEPQYVEEFALKLNNALRMQNIYYDDLIMGSVLRNLRIVRVAKGGFVDYMKSQGKLGGQNKIPRLSNDRNIVDQLKLV